MLPHQTTLKNKNQFMKNIIALIMSLFIITVSFTQTSTEYFYKGDSLYGAKDFKNSGLAYAAGIRVKGSEAMLFRYIFCAAIWSLGGEPDSAFHYLDIISR